MGWMKVNKIKQQSEDSLSQELRFDLYWKYWFIVKEISFDFEMVARIKDIQVGCN